MQSSDEPAFPVRQGVLVRARNGDVIRYDATGLVLRLSDRVIEDIRQRLGAPEAQGQPATGAAPDAGDDEALLDGLDVWDIRAEGDWLRFAARLPGAQGPRAFRRHRAGGGIIAEAPGPLLGILGLGGPRAALATPRVADFPYHVLTADDGIGAVGQSGVDTAALTPRLGQLREMTHEALVADTLLGWQMDKHAALPLFVVRTEADGSASAAELASGPALANLMIAADNLREAAAAQGRAAQIMAVALDFALEEIGGTAAGYRDAMIALMTRITEELQRRGFDKPLFVTRLDAGAPGLATAAQVQGQWELAWNAGGHKLIVSAPGYMFEMDDCARPTARGRQHMAMMTAAALSAARLRPHTPDPLADGWHCPIFHLAEYERDGTGATVLRLIGQAQSALVLEPGVAAVPEGAAPVGLALDDPGGARITAVGIDPDDDRTVVLTLDRAPAEGATLVYGWGTPDPAATVAVRDGWDLPGTDLRRWALPCILPVHPGRIARDDQP